MLESLPPKQKAGPNTSVLMLFGGMLTVTLTYDEALALLRKAVETNGADYVYPNWKETFGCRYFGSAGEPSCIVGHVLADKGVTLAELSGLDECRSVRAGSVANLDLSPPELAKRGLIEADPRTVALLKEAQWQQDYGVAWGLAVEKAVRVANGN